MSVVSECLKQILSARYGRDVRQSIHDGIKEVDSVARTAQNSATVNAQTASAKASEALTASQEALQKAQEAFESAERAKTYAENAEAVTGVNIASQGSAGIIKGGDNHIAEDGTLELVVRTAEATMPNSKAGSFLFEKIGGVSSQDAVPTLDVPQEIKKSVVSEIKTHGKNFLKVTQTMTSARGLTIEYLEDGGVRLYGVNNSTEETGVFVMPLVTNETKLVLHPGTYIISGCPEGGSWTTYSFRPNGTQGKQDIGSGNTFVVTEESTWKPSIVLASDTYGAEIDLTFYPMIRDASIEDATYESYEESANTLSQPIELNGIDDLQDVIEDGKVKRRFAEIVYNGSENWTREVTALGFVRFYRGITGGLNTEQRSKIYTTHFRYSSGGTTDGSGVYAFYNGRIHLYADFDTVEEFKAWLAENNVTVIYPLDDETIEELPVVDQIALNSIETFNGATHMEFISTEIKPIFNGIYGTSEVGVLALQALNNSIAISDHCNYQDISGILANMSASLSGQACKENGMVVINITVPASAVTGNFGGVFSIQLTDSNYFPRIAVGGNYWCAKEGDRGALYNASISSDGMVKIEFSAALNDTVSISFVYPARFNK